jgi:hypothetical protein
VLIALLLLNKTKAQSGDTVYLKTGQILIGQLKSLELGRISFDDNVLDVLSIKTTKIKTISTRYFFRIETIEKDFYYGKLKASGKTGNVIITLLDTAFEMQLADISSLSLYRKAFFKRLDGNVSAGYTYTKSSEIGQINLNANINYVAKKNHAELTASTIGTFDSSVYSRDREQLQLSDNYYFTSTWFAAAAASYQRNLELSLARRFQQMAGIGNKFLLTNSCQAYVISGLTLNQEKSTDGTNSDLLVELPIAFRFDFFKFSKPNLQFTTTQTFYISLSQEGRYRYDGNNTLAWEIIKDFSLSLNIYTSYDSKPPVATSPTTDYGIVFGLSYKFNQ